jgi:hypothetical protein
VREDIKKELSYMVASNLRISKGGYRTKRVEGVAHR